MKKRAILASWLMVLAALFLIFKLSEQPAKESNALSKELSAVVLRIVHAINPEAELTVWQVNKYLRRVAHFGIYLILGLAMDNSLRISGMEGKQRILLAILFCGVYAVGDELFQMMVPGRGSELQDVLTDSAGAVLGVLICERVWEIVYAMKRRKSSQ